MKTFANVLSVIQSMDGLYADTIVKFMRHAAAGGRLYLLEVQHTDGDTYLYPDVVGKRTTVTTRRGTFFTGVWFEPVNEIVNWSVDQLGNARGYDADYVHRAIVPTHMWMEMFGDIAKNVVSKRFDKPMSTLPGTEELSRQYWDVVKSTDGGMDFNTAIMRQYLQCLELPTLPANARQAAAMGLPVELFR